MGGFGFAAQKGMGFEIVFHKRIGLHFLTVVLIKELIKEPIEFSEWFEDFVAERGFSASLPEGFAAAISNYISRGYNYFVIDLINVFTEQRSAEPIQYRFKSDKLYHPLKITSTIKSQTSINLFILARDEVRNEDLRKAGMWKRYKSDIYTFISKSKLMDVNPEIANLGWSLLHKRTLRRGNRSAGK